MARTFSSALLISAACLALAACGKSDKQPTGQVVATVDGEEITAIELRNELAQVNVTDPKVRRAVERQALDGIITRKWLAMAAKKAGVDKTPEYAQQKERMEEALLVQTWQANIAKLVPTPTREEADAFVAQNPDVYANRLIFVTDQIRIPRNVPPTLIQQMQPLNTLEEVEALLVANKIPMQKGEFRFDAATLDPKVVTQINKLPDGEVFVLPNGNLFLINRMKEKVVQPFTGPAATQHAINYLKGQRTQEAIRRQLGSAMTGAKEKVKFAKAYEPPPAAKAAAPAAKAAAPKAAPAAPAAPATGAAPAASKSGA